MNIRAGLAAAVLVAMMGMGMWMFAVQLAESLPPHPSEAMASIR